MKVKLKEKCVVCLHQPQNSMPDVIIWMLRGEKRVAFARVPANEILYTNFSEQGCGKHCGQTQTIFMQVPNSLKKHIYFRLFSLS